MVNMLNQLLHPRTQSFLFTPFYHMHLYQLVNIDQIYALQSWLERVYFLHMLIITQVSLSRHALS